jgi:hypothetical protein
VALSVRDVFWHSEGQQHWLLDLDWLVYWHIALPVWAVAAVNLAFHAGLLWGCVLFYRVAQGKERVLVIGWTAIVSVGLIQFLISASAATEIEPVKAILAVAAFLAALDIFKTMAATGYPRVDGRTSQNP